MTHIPEEGSKRGGMLGEESYFVGKCQSCRHAGQEQERGGRLRLICHQDGVGTITKPNWQCGAYEYEPGSLA
jgi:hypothetical protein